jgi:hypothetical protein
MADAKTCLNCATTLSGHTSHCPHCGQSTAVGRVTLGDIGDDFARAIFDIDRSVFSLLRALIVRPGVVADDYSRGARRRYFGPFAFLFTVVGLTSLAIALSGFEIVTSDDAANAFVRFAQSHPNALLLAQVPILAGIARLLFRSDARRFAEYLVLAAYTIAMRAAFIAVVAVPIWYVVRDHPLAGPPLVVAYWFLWFLYFGIAAMQFHASRRAWHALGGFAVAAATQYVSVTIIDRLANLIG